MLQGSGKSFYAEKLAAKYYIPHVKIEQIISSALSANDEFAEKLQQLLAADAAAAGKNKRNKEKEKAKASAAAKASASTPSSGGKGSKKGSGPLSPGGSSSAPVDLSLFDSDAPRLPAYFLCKLLKRFLRQPLQRNKGFVLDGFPRNNEESKWIFSPDVEEDPESGEPLVKIEDKRALALAAAAANEEEEEMMGGGGGGGGGLSEPAEPQPRDPSTMVDSVIVLNCSQSLAIERMKRLPPSQLVPGHNDEEGFLRRWARYCAVNELNTTTGLPANAAIGSPTANATQPSTLSSSSSSDNLFSSPPLSTLTTDAVNSPLWFIQDSIELLDLPESLSAHTSAAQNLMQLYLTKKGPPFNYHPTEAELAQEAALKTAATQADALRNEGDKKEKALLELNHRRHLEQNHALRRAAVLLEDQMLIEAASLPIRSYLMANVIPALVDGLLDVCKVQPEDAVDHLAEFLFKYAVDTPADVENAQNRPVA